MNANHKIVPSRRPCERAGGSQDSSAWQDRSAARQPAAIQAPHPPPLGTTTVPAGRVIPNPADWNPALRGRGFTLIELLAVLAVVLLAAAMLAPGFAHSQPNSRTAQCLSNKRLVAMACAMYTADSNDYLVPNAPAAAATGWCIGQENWGSTAANTNRDYYTTNCLAPYVAGQIRAYKCPGDTIPSDNGDRLRSISMNGMMIGAVPPPGGGSSNPGWRTYKKYGDIFAPAPAMAWIFADENMYTLNDGYMQLSLNSVDYPDVPAAYHGGINCLSFADGHGEPHKWRWLGTASAGLMNCPYAKDLHGSHWPSSGQDVDWLWLQVRSSARQ
jgi:prepilin-type N-terminal cleavage/methylation domain-containing protein